MTNDQLIERVIDLETKQAKSEAELEKITEYIKELQEDVKTTKNLTEDVHIMARSIESMQVSLSDTNRKVDELVNKDYNNYKENKEAFKQHLRSAFFGSLATLIIAALGVLFKMIIEKGGVI